MATLFPKMSEELDAVQMRLLRGMPVWRRFQIVGQLTEARRQAVMAELLIWFPQAGPDELRRRFATIWLGPELAAAAYGPEPDPPTTA